MSKVSITDTDGNLTFSMKSTVGPQKANVKDTCAAIRAVGMSVRHDNGEYRVTFPGLPTDRAEALAHYTTDADDAIGTARHMASKAGETLAREKANSTMITRDNIDSLLDRRQIEVAMTHGKWWEIRRAGATKHFKRDPLRIVVPYKMGMHGHGTITEVDFGSSEILNPGLYRVKQPR
jgi:hypothetical protein